MDVDAEDEELADLHEDLPSGEVDVSGQRDLLGDVLRRVDCVVDKVFEDRSLLETTAPISQVHHIGCERPNGA